MALLKYFKMMKSPLPDLEGPLSTHVTIEGANKEIMLILNDNQLNKCQWYLIIK